MKIIHLCSYYIGSNLYSKLVESLNQQGVKQKLFIPIRKDSERNKNRSSTLDQNDYVYSRCMYKIFRLSYFIKLISFFITAFTYRKKLDIVGCDHIHCHTLFSDGGLGLLLKLVFGKSYSVTVRNTDVNVYLKYFPHLRLFAYLILKYSDNVIFISPAYKAYCIKKYTFTFSNSLDKLKVIPNGVDPYWISNAKVKAASALPDREYKLIFVGDINKNKNVLGLIDVCNQLANKAESVELVIVGGDKAEFERLLSEKIINPKVLIRVKGKVFDKLKLAKLMASADVLVVPSFTETFGLVYIEALSQGTPIVFSLGQALTGFFNENSKFANTCNPYDSISILQAIDKSRLNPPTKEQQTVIMNQFNWDQITPLLIDNIYSS